jgi:hypothetical protein
MADSEVTMFRNPNRIGSEAGQRVYHLCPCMDAATIDDPMVDLSDARIGVASGSVSGPTA